jgi:oligopeptide/dipeptide ABC transporter ATP-binding protein
MLIRARAIRRAKDPQVDPGSAERTGDLLVLRTIAHSDARDVRTADAPAGQPRGEMWHDILDLQLTVGEKVTTPKLIVADEPVSALDVSIQAQILNLLKDLQSEFQLTYLFIAHDLNVVRHVCDRVAVMYLGKIVELSPVDELYATPVHPYTDALLSAVPVPEAHAHERLRRRVVLGGDVPSPVAPPPACRFHPRCRYATEICHTIEPPLLDRGNDRTAACHHPLNVAEAAARGPAGSARSVGTASRPQASAEGVGLR